MKIIAASAFALTFACVPALADEPDGLKLPPGFHATVVADGLTGARHLAVRDNGDIYISTRAGRGQAGLGIIALHVGADGKADRTEHFATADANATDANRIDGGTGIRFYKGALYATSVTGVYRFDLPSDGLVPTAAPTLIVDGIPTGGQLNRMLAFDGKGGMYVSVSGSGNICADAVPATAPKGTKPVGQTPCPSLANRSGIWRFDAKKAGQKFPAGGTQVATGIRDMDSMDWRAGDALYAIMHDRNGTSATWPDLVSAADENNIAEEMHRVTKGTDFGWPYTYYDGARNVRLTAPEYGGDGKTAAKAGTYDAPALAFTGHSAPLDMLFYTAKQFPAAYRGGAFVAMHGGNGPAIPGGHNGYNIVYVTFDRAGKVDGWSVFADGFAGPAPTSRLAASAAYRPVGLAIAPDGGLYVADSQKGKLWKISYSGG
jgi:glucose/arabinose dehydrogenase